VIGLARSRCQGDHATGRQRPRGDALVRADDGLAQLVGARGVDREQHQLPVAGAVEKRARGRAAHRRYLGDHARGELAHGLGAAHGRLELVEQLQVRERARQPLGRGLHLEELARLVDRHGGLRREGAEQLGVVRGERDRRARLELVERLQHADELAACRDDRRRDDRARGVAALGVPAAIEAPIALGVGDTHHLAALGDVPGDSAADRDLDGLEVVADLDARHEPVALPHVERRAIGAEHLHGRVEQHGEQLGERFFRDGHAHAPQRFAGPARPFQRSLELRHARAPAPSLPGHDATVPRSPASRLALPFFPWLARPPMSLKQVHMRVFGRVQGVYYRASAQREAKRLGLTGWVKNRKDLTVELMAEGEEAGIKDLIAWAQRGPSAARVDKVDVRWRSFCGDFPDFRIVD
jgi:acylphosphatase